MPRVKLTKEEKLVLYELAIKANKNRPRDKEGGRPPVYPPCTSLIPYGANKGKPRGRHRFKNGVCSCGQVKKTT
jgi:hypothetical protein